jgi:hypothetical protein
MSITTNYFISSGDDLGTVLQPNINIYLWTNSASTNISAGTSANVGSFTFNGVTGYYNLSLMLGVYSSNSNSSYYWANISTVSNSIDTSSDVYTNSNGVTDGSIPAIYNIGVTSSRSATNNVYSCAYSRNVKLSSWVGGNGTQDIWSGATYFLNLVNATTYYVNLYSGGGNSITTVNTNIKISGPTIINNIINL